MKITRIDFSKVGDWFLFEEDDADTYIYDPETDEMYSESYNYRSTYPEYIYIPYDPQDPDRTYDSVDCDIARWKYESNCEPYRQERWGW